MSKKIQVKKPIIIKTHDKMLINVDKVVQGVAFDFTYLIGYYWNSHNQRIYYIKSKYDKYRKLITKKDYIDIMKNSKIEACTFDFDKDRLVHTLAVLPYEQYNIRRYFESK